MSHDWKHKYWILELSCCFGHMTTHLFIYFVFIYFLFIYKCHFLTKFLNAGLQEMFGWFLRFHTKPASLSLSSLSASLSLSLCLCFTNEEAHSHFFIIGARRWSPVILRPSRPAVRAPPPPLPRSPLPCVRILSPLVRVCVCRCRR